MDRASKLEEVAVQHLAGEYLAYKRWSRRRGQRFICPIGDYHRSIIIRLDLRLEAVDAELRRQEG